MRLALMSRGVLLLLLSILLIGCEARLGKLGTSYFQGGEDEIRMDMSKVLHRRILEEEISFEEQLIQVEKAKEDRDRELNSPVEQTKEDSKADEKKEEAKEVIKPDKKDDSTEVDSKPEKMKVNEKIEEPKDAPKVDEKEEIKSDEKKDEGKEVVRKVEDVKEDEKKDEVVEGTPNTKEEVAAIGKMDQVRTDVKKPGEKEEKKEDEKKVEEKKDEEKKEETKEKKEDVNLNEDQKVEEEQSSEQKLTEGSKREEQLLAEALLLENEEKRIFDEKDKTAKEDGKDEAKVDAKEAVKLETKSDNDTETKSTDEKKEAKVAEKKDEDVKEDLKEDKRESQPEVKKEDEAANIIEEVSAIAKMDQVRLDVQKVEDNIAEPKKDPKVVDKEETTEPKQEEVTTVVDSVDPDEDYPDFLDEFFRLPERLQESAEHLKMVPAWEKISTNTKDYFKQANEQIKESFTPLIGREYAPVVAYLVSYGLLLLPLGLVMFLFERVRAIFSLQKVLLFINIYVAAYFAALVMAAFILGGEPMDFFRNFSPSSYIFLQLLQAFGYICFIILQTFDLITTCSSGRIAAKLSALLQWLVVVAVGFHYYVTVFHRAMAKSKPLTSWKIYGLYSISFTILCAFARIERGKKQYIQEGGEETTKQN